MSSSGGGSQAMTWLIWWMLPAILLRSNIFDIAPHNSKPVVRPYLPTRKYGPDDLTIAHRLMDWMKARGRGAYCDRYLSLKAVGEHRGLENGTGIHSFISYEPSSDGGEPDVKTLLLRFITLGGLPGRTNLGIGELLLV
ncbi:hypothetical protein F5Y11DRAFT_123296 [Daldinia sp. FL1419]|nr:hypothetical protein F5Y11DRAFT_123296 [Daldinia sp. FL1419]